MAQNKRTIASVPVGRFKAECLALMKEVNESREPLLITKRGKPMVQVIPVEDAAANRGFGAMSGRVRYHADIVAPDKTEWDENA